jgi:glutaminyl-peptide cyclotransferase
MRRVAGGLTVVVLLALVVWVLMFQPWMGNAEPPSTKRTADVFAADRETLPEPAPFDARRAMSYLDAVCKIGPRISGTDGMKKQQELLEKHFKEQGGQTDFQPFTARQRSVRKPVDMANLIVSWHPERPRRLILCSHYDTRPLADQEHDTRRWREPFLSANDGGSGVALLMELAHHVKDLKLALGVDFVFFDGEEYVFEHDDEYFLGSKHFGREYRKARARKRYEAAILLDMVGGKNAHFPLEQTSWNQQPRLVQTVWDLAAHLKCNAFDSTSFSHVAVQDDHVPLNQNGIPAIDIIDFRYPHWHRLSDLPENCSGDSLEQVARVLSVWLQWVK